MINKDILGILADNTNGLTYEEAKGYLSRCNILDHTISGLVYEEEVLSIYNKNERFFRKYSHQNMLQMSDIELVGYYITQEVNLNTNRVLNMLNIYPEQD